MVYLFYPPTNPIFAILSGYLPYVPRTIRLYRRIPYAILIFPLYVIYYAASYPICLSALFFLR